MTASIEPATAGSISISVWAYAAEANATAATRPAPTAASRPNPPAHGEPFRRCLSVPAPAFLTFALPSVRYAGSEGRVMGSRRDGAGEFPRAGYLHT